MILSELCHLGTDHGLELLSLTGFYTLWLIVYRLYLHPLAKFPGPRAAAITPLWKFLHVYNGTIVDATLACHKTFGHIVRIGPNEVSIQDPDAVPEVLNHHTEYAKGPFYDGFVPAGANKRSLFTERSEKAHTERRKSVAFVYAMSNLVQLEEYCDSVTRSLIQFLDRTQDQVLDLGEVALFYATDIVGELAFGSAFGLVKSGKDESGLAHEISQNSHFSAILGSIPVLARLINNKTSLAILSKVQGKAIGTSIPMQESIKLVNKRIQEDREGKTGDRRDMLYDLFQAKNPDGTRFTQLDVIREAFSILNAGSDTTATTLRACIRYIYGDAATLKRAREEIDQALAEGKATLPVPYSKAVRLDFVQACIKEALRMHPAVGMPLQRVVPEGGRVVANVFYPQGTLIGISPWAIHHDPRAFGPDADVWNPDRWLNETEEERKSHAKNLLSFGSGSRICIGKNISLLEISKVIVVLIFAYDIEFQNPQEPYKTCQHWFTPQNGFYCRVKRRADASRDVAECFE